MIRTLVISLVVSVACATAASAQEAASQSNSQPRYTQRQLRQMIRDAHTPDQYTAIANYYAGLQQEYLRKAEKEKKEWEEMSRENTWMGAKAPRPVDFKRDAYRMDEENATRAQSASAKYSHLALAQ